MSDKKLIETAFVELKNSTKGYLSIKDISLVKELNDNDYTNKAHFILFGSKYFRNHASTAIAFSEFGLDISSKFDTIEQYEKSLKKPDYFKIITTIIAIGTFIIVSLTYFNDKEKKELRNKLENKNATIDSLKTNSLSNPTTKHK
jgi:hypothetical protein